MEINKELIDKYLRDNWSHYFGKCLMEVIKETLLLKDENSQREWKEELKQCIWEAMTQGVKDYLEDDPEYFIEKISEELVDRIEVNAQFKKSEKE